MGFTLKDLYDLEMQVEAFCRSCFSCECYVAKLVLGVPRDHS